MSPSRQSNTFFGPDYLRDAERYLGRIMSIVAHAMFFILLVRFFVVEPGITDGISMEPTLPDHTFFFVEKMYSFFVPLQRYDIVQTVDPDNHSRLIMKRIVGLPHEKVIFSQNKVFIQNEQGERQLLDEHYLSKNIINGVPYGMAKEITVPANSYVILGDNRPNSRDSRFFGPVHRKLITGKVFPVVLR